MSKHTFTFNDDELQCLRVCLQNAPTPYHISKKKIVSELEDKIGKPIVEEHPPLRMPKYDLSKYGITE